MSAAVISRGSISENRNKQSALALERVLLQKDRETAEAYGVVGTPSAVLIERGRIASPLAAGGDAIRSLVADVTSARVRKGQIAPDLPLVNLAQRSLQPRNAARTTVAAGVLESHVRVLPEDARRSQTP